MERTTLGNRPNPLAIQTRIEDFSEGDAFVRVSMKLSQGMLPDTLTLDAQAFEVDANGVNVIAPDGRPSRTPGTQSTIATSALGDTHTLLAGWVRKVGTYVEADFTVLVTEKPTSEGAVGDEVYDTTTGIAYRWDEGEALRIARGKVDELMRIRANSGALSGLTF